MRSVTRLTLVASFVAGPTLFAIGCFSSSSSGGSTQQPGFDGGPDFDGGGDTTSPAEGGLDATMDATTETGTESGAMDSGIEASPEASTEAGTEAGTDAAADVATEAGVVGTVFYVDPVNGLDTNPGTQASPFQTIFQAGAAIDLVTDAGAGPFTVMLADGTYDAANQSSKTQIWFHNHPTLVHGSAPGNVTFQGANAGEYMVFGQGGAVQNVAFNGTSNGAQGVHGTFAVSGCSFVNTSGYAVAFINETVGTFDTTGGVTIQSPAAPNQLGGIYVDNTASVTWTGGGTTSITTGQPYSNLIFMRNAAQLTVDGVNVSNYPGYVYVGYDQAHITWKNSTITGSGWQTGVSGLGSGGAFYIGANQNGVPSPSVSLSNVSLTGSLGSAIAVQILPTTGTVTLDFTGSHLDGSSFSAVWANGTSAANLALNVTANGTTFDNNGYAAIVSPRATVSFSGTGNSVSGNGASAGASGQTPGGIVLTDGTSVSSVTLRGTTLSGNTGNAIALAGTAASALDLGTAASPGGNVFSGVGATSTAVDLTALIAATAIGNTWMPGVQGADATGKYATTTTLTGPQAGQNVTEPAGASIVMAP